MKKAITILTIIVFLVAVLVAVAATANCSNKIIEAEEEEIIWVEEGERQEDDGLRSIGIRFEEVDLTKPTLQGPLWDEVGHDVEPRSDLSHILDQSIATRDEAAILAKKVLRSEQYNEETPALELMLVQHDPNKNIWIFAYWENIIDLNCHSLQVAVDGGSGELIRMWVL